MGTTTTTVDEDEDYGADRDAKSTGGVGGDCWSVSSGSSSEIGIIEGLGEGTRTVGD
jgi:hypothetical protein